MYFFNLILTGSLNFSIQGRSACILLVEAISDYFLEARTSEKREDAASH